MILIFFRDTICKHFTTYLMFGTNTIWSLLKQWWHLFNSFIYKPFVLITRGDAQKTASMWYYKKGALSCDFPWTTKTVDLNRFACRLTLRFEYFHNILAGQTAQSQKHVFIHPIHPICHTQQTDVVKTDRYKPTASLLSFEDDLNRRHWMTGGISSGTESRIRARCDIQSAFSEGLEGSILDTRKCSNCCYTNPSFSASLQRKHYFGLPTWKPERTK